ncbi:MAG: methyltransferase domain-containing protein [Planctomycetota bacterium]
METPATGSQRPIGALRTAQPAPQQALASVADRALVEELVARLRSRQVFGDDRDLAWLGALLTGGLRDQLDVHVNRFSRQRSRDAFQALWLHLQPPPSLAGATVVDLGCGGSNPGGIAFLFLALGAQRGIAIDLDEIADQRLAVRALADLAANLLFDAKGLVGGAAIRPEQVLQNLASFQLGRLQAGDPAGIDFTRLAYRQESAARTSLADGEADFVFSTNLLEHVADPGAVTREVARITRRGGVGVHVIDLSDHRRYAGDRHLLEFLREPGPGFLHGCNRLRRSMFPPLFAAHGLSITACDTLSRCAVDAKLRASFAAPWRDLDQDDLEVTMIRVTTRRD